MTKVAQESLSALRTVQAFNANKQEELKFHQKVDHVLSLARKEAVASGIFFGSTGWSGNVTLLALLGYGQWIFRIALRIPMAQRTRSSGGTLVSGGAITVGDLTSLLLYTVYVGSGLQMLSYVASLHSCDVF